MIHPETHVVKTCDERPARRDGTCFYCRVPIGSVHRADCVLRLRTVVMRVSLEVVLRVPEFWDVGNIDNHKNDSSWCAGNWREILEEWFEGMDRIDTCPCGRIASHYIREATQDDELAIGFEMKGDVS